MQSKGITYNFKEPSNDPSNVPSNDQSTPVKRKIKNGNKDQKVR